MLTVFNCGHSPTVRWEFFHPHAVTVLCGKGVDVTSHNKRPDTVVVVVGQRGMASAQILEQILDMLVLLVVEERCCGAGGRRRSTEVEHRSGARQGLVAAADRRSRFLT